MRPTSVRGRAALMLTLWLAFLTCALVGLHGLGGGMAPPPLTDPQSVSDWLNGRTPADAAFAVLRLVSLGLAWYLLAATVLSTLARLSRVPAAIRAADVLTVPAVRRLAHAAAGASVAVATVSAGTGMAGAAGSRWSGPDATALEVSPPSSTPTTSLSTTPIPSPPIPSTPAAIPTLRRLGDEPPPPAVPPPGALPGTEAPGPPLQAPPTPEPGAAPSSGRWEVQPGQHFWAVAEKVLATAWPRPPSEADIDRYWRHLVEANQRILRDPANPDLLYPGQVLDVPAPPPPAPAPAPEQPPATEPAAGPGAVAPDR